MLYVELFTQGLIYGCMYAIIAVGLTLVYGLLRILHVAHAGLFTLGAYLGLIVTNATGSLLLALPVSAIFVGLVGMAIIVLGGLGNVTGTLIASVILGVLEAFGTIYVGDYLDRDAIAFAFLILVLMLKPQGLFSRK